MRSTDAAMKRTGVRRRSKGIEHTVIDRAVSVTALNLEMGTIRRMLNLATDWGVIDAAPKVRLSGQVKQVERILTHEEESQYLQNAPQPLKDFATVCLDTGMRPGEIVRLRWEHV